jgi:hypothetical protein
VGSRGSHAIAATEIAPSLNDFVRREVLFERDNVFGFNLPLFRLWLVDVGVSQLIGDSLSEELADLVLAEENKAAIRSEEVVALSQTWPTYRGKHIGTDEIRAWYQQVEGLREQRILFKLLERTQVVSEALVRERLGSAHRLLRPFLPEFVIERRGARRRDILLTYVDGPGKSGASFAATYAEENRIAAECVVAPQEFEKDRLAKPAAIVLVDDIAATGTSLSDNIRTFVHRSGDYARSVPILAVTLVATAEGQRKIEQTMSELREQGFDISFRACSILPDVNYAFPTATTVWEDAEQAERAKALCTDLGSRIYLQDPLGFGGMGLLVVFPTTVPNNSLPILHSFSRAGSSKRWSPLFERPVN